MKNRNAVAAIGTAIIIALAIPAYIQLAKWGEPSSSWIVCTVFGAKSVCD